MDNDQDDVPKKISEPRAISAEEMTEFSHQGRPVARSDAKHPGIPIEASR
jgi:hypothetical protein